MDALNEESDNELFTELALLITLRMGNDFGVVDMGDEERKDWTDRALTAVLAAGLRVGAIEPVGAPC